MKKELHKHYDTIERDVRQASHTKWLQLGDKNMAFFGDATKARKNQNSLFKLLNERGEMYTSKEEIKGKCVDYFIELYTQLAWNLDYKPWFPMI